MNQQTDPAPARNPDESRLDLGRLLPIGALVLVVGFGGFAYLKSLQEAENAAKVLIERGAASVILTLGERGSLLVTGETAEHVAVAPVKALDTTGAGDAFVGSLAFFLAAGKSLPDTIRRANRIAAISDQSSDTQTSFPEAEDLPLELIN